jgi:hypothetical protein
MAYYLSAAIAKTTAFEEAGILCRALAQGFSITNRIPDASTFPRGAKLALVSADYFGGCGDQRAIVMLDGTEVSSYDDNVSGAINAALRDLGVVAAEGMDEFDTLGLGKERGNEWVSDPDEYWDEPDSDDPYDHDPFLD